MLQLSPGKTPARGREADQLAGTAGDGGNKDGPGPDAVMEKTHRGAEAGAGAGAAGRGGARPAALPPSPAGPGGAALGPCPGALLAGGGEARENRKCQAGRGGQGTENQKRPGSGCCAPACQPTHPVLSAGTGGWRGWCAPGTRGAAHGHFAAAAAGDGRPLGGAHRLPPPHPAMARTRVWRLTRSVHI